MKIPAIFFRAGLIGTLSVVIGLAAVLETNVEPAAPVAPVQVVVPEMDELREQLRAMQRSNEEMKRSSEQASEKWAQMVDQNSALSNVLSGLQQTLITQNGREIELAKREVELAKQSNSFYIKIITGAAVAVFLVFL